MNCVDLNSSLDSGLHSPTLRPCERYQGAIGGGSLWGVHRTLHWNAAAWERCMCQTRQGETAETMGTHGPEPEKNLCWGTHLARQFNCDFGLGFFYL